MLELFAQISRIPRCSGSEAAVAAHVMDWARQHTIEGVQDSAGNIIVRVPAVDAVHDSPVVLQAHLDMVCEADPDSTHDFAVDPIEIRTDGEWLHAASTTLGADNGIGCALMMAVAESTGLPRPALELLFTVEEETGLRGAESIDAGLVSGRTLVNLDSETEGVFTVGCAGGKDYTVTLPCRREATPPDYSGYEITVGGLTGGHSGVDIHRGRANANLLLAGILGDLLESPNTALSAVSGGSARNAIPREASAVLAAQNDAITSIVRQAEVRLRAGHARTDPTLYITLGRCELPATTVDSSTAAAYLQLLGSLPHGVTSMAASIPGLVEASSNVAVVSTTKTEICIHCNLRSSSIQELAKMETAMDTASRAAGAASQASGEYPAWQPNLKPPWSNDASGSTGRLLPRSRGYEPSMRDSSAQ